MKPYPRKKLRRRAWLAAFLVVLSFGIGCGSPTGIAIDALKYVGESDGSVNVDVTLDKVYTDTVTVQYATQAGTATAGTDFDSTSGTLVFPPGETKQTITVNILNDAIGESDEVLYLSISNPENANLKAGAQTCNINIIDDDNPPPTVQFDSATAVVSEGTGAVTLTVTLSALAPKAVTVNYATANGTAVTGTDYTTTTGTLTFALGETSKTITIPILDDIVYEDSESFTLKLSSPSSGLDLGSQSTVTVTIGDDDPVPPTVQFDLASYSAGESDGSTTVYVTLSTAALAPVTVKYATKDGSAATGADYLATSGTLTFPIGVTSLPITIPILNDTAPESSETFTLELSDITWGTAGYQISTEVTIADDDATSPVVPLTVTATGGTFSPDPAPIGSWVDVTLNAKATRPDPGTATLGSPSWSWKVVNASYSTESESGPWTDGSGSYSVCIDPTSAPSPDGTYDYSAVVLSASFPNDGSWNLSCNSQAAYSDSEETEYVGAAIAQGKGSVTRVLIWTDIDHDGKIDFSKGEDKDSKLKKDKGTIVISDQDSVYIDTAFPARRREIQVTAPGKDTKVIIKRSSSNVLLFDSKTDGTDLFGKNDEVEAVTSKSYWLHGGTSASKNECDHWLKVRQSKVGSAFEDELRITVLWVEISGNASGKAKKGDLFDGGKLLIPAFGHEDLGVIRSVPKSVDTEIKAKGEKIARGHIQVQGKILPNDFAWGGSVDFKWERNKVTKAAKASSKSGFIFKRKVSFKDYINGNAAKTVLDSAEDRDDDSIRDFQDVDPNFDGTDLLIIDQDGPSIRAAEDIWFQHRRFNATQQVVFNYDTLAAERVSKTYKWAFTGDVAFGEEFKLLFIRGEPNKTEDFNSVLLGKHLADLNVEFKVPTIKQALTAANNDMKIRRNQTEIIVVDGTDLIGTAYLWNGQQLKSISASVVRVKKSATNALVGDITQIRVAITTDLAASAGWELVVSNSKGETSIKGFEIVN